MNIDFNFDYLNNYPDKKDELKKMYLLTYDGLRIPLERIDDRLYFDCPFVDMNNNIYVIPINLWPFSLSRPDEEARRAMLKQKFNTNYNIKEWRYLEAFLRSA